MNLARLPLLVLAGTFLFGSLGLAEETGPVRFAAPQRIRAGDAFLGEGRLYPSPVLYDVNGDQRPDILVGDLIGHVTVAHRQASRNAVAFGSEQPINDRDGKPLRFHNW